MGCFDTVRVPCPRCGKIEEAQSRGGDCDLEVYSLINCPVDVMSDINRHAPFTCDDCGVKFRVECQVIAQVCQVDG